MLTKEQNEALERGVDCYQRYCDIGENTDAALDILIEAFETLGTYVDEVDDIYYKVIFANVVQDLQDSGEITLSNDCQDTKLEIYLETLKWFENTESYKPFYKPYLWSVFNSLAKIFLKGEELQQNDKGAWICYRDNKILEHPMADVMLSKFVEDGNGNVTFIGVRPE